MVGSGMMALLLGLLVVSADLLHAEEEDLCKLPPETGLCRARQPKFHFNPENQGCEMFFYGGCGGNQNRFDSEELCLLACGGKGHRRSQAAKPPHLQQERARAAQPWHPRVPRHPRRAVSVLPWSRDDVAGAS